MHSILIFGGTGFLGSALVKLLLSKKITVCVVYRDNLGFLKNIQSNSLKLIRSDIQNLNLELLDKYNFSAVYHLAAQKSVKDASFEILHQSNELLSYKIVHLVKCLNVDQMIYVSSLSVFGYESFLKSSVLDETSLIDPSDYYGLSKYNSEKLLQIELSSCDIQLSIVRFPSIFGKNHFAGIVHTFQNLAISQQVIELFNQGRSLRNLLYIESAIDFLYKLFF